MGDSDGDVFGGTGVAPPPVTGVEAPGAVPATTVLLEGNGALDRIGAGLEELALGMGNGAVAEDATLDEDGGPEEGAGDDVGVTAVERMTEETGATILEVMTSVEEA